MTTTSLLAGIDAGGTSFKLAIAAADGMLLQKDRVPTTTPDETIAAAATRLEEMAAAAGGPIGAVGIASFGPVDVDPASENYGTILATPKDGWAGTPLLGQMTAALGCPGALDTDVNGALLAEMTSGAAKGASRAAYVTVGTGIGVGVRSDGRFAGRPAHPELGHIPVARAPGDDYAGHCPFHQDCLEGLGAAPALTARFGPLEALPVDHPAWDLAAYYLAQLAVTLTLGFRAERLVLGGGVMEAPALLPAIQRAYAGRMAGYVDDHPPEALIQKAGLGPEAGVRGACLLAASLRR